MLARNIYEGLFIGQFKRDFYKGRCASASASGRKKRLATKPNDTEVSFPQPTSSRCAETPGRGPN